MSTANDITTQPQEQQQQQHAEPAPQQQPQPIHIIVNIRHVPQEEFAAQASASAAAAAANQQASSSSSDSVKKKVKRNVALHVGYVGTNYTGGVACCVSRKASMSCLLAIKHGTPAICGGSCTKRAASSSLALCMPIYVKYHAPVLAHSGTTLCSAPTGWPFHSVFLLCWFINGWDNSEPHLQPSAPSRMGARTAHSIAALTTPPPLPFLAPLPLPPCPPRLSLPPPAVITGLQANRQLPGLPTIEGVLEEAILKAGMITVSNSRLTSMPDV
jgi:hypothetical protein